LAGVREVSFVDTAGGARFAVVTRPSGAVRGALLYVHPFAEEMNKSRRMVSLGAFAFADAGWLVLQIDLGGCGDSAGEFGDSGWAAWLDDVSAGWAWLERRTTAPLALWSLRAGSLLVADWLARSAERPPLLLWQPVIDGRQHLNQFLRLKVASDMLAATDARSAATALRADLDAGRAVEVAGYRLTPELAAGLGAAKLRLPQPYASDVAVLEGAAGDRSEPSPAVAALASSWREAAVPVDVALAHGPSFWQTTEIETAPAFIDASLRAMQRWPS
jgi:exosortase A-associated hydrolase 2